MKIFDFRLLNSGESGNWFDFKDLILRSAPNFFETD